MDSFLQWLAANPNYVYVTIFGLACIEALVGVGLFVSGAILLSVSTFLHVQGLITIPQLLPLAFAGAFLGDQSGFWLGRRLGPGFKRSGFAQRHEARIQRVEKMINRFGWGAIIFGRLMTAVRSLVPLMTGMAGFHPLRYLAFDLLAVSIWTLGLWGLTIGVGEIF